jgi:hypothetical protein
MRIARYEIRDEKRGLLGQGAHGDTYRAYDTVAEEEVALKLLRSTADSFYWASQNATGTVSFIAISSLRTFSWPTVASNLATSASHIGEPWMGKFVVLYPTWLPNSW